MRELLFFGLVLSIGGVFPTNCPNFFNGTDCTQILCINGGYVKDSTTNFCTCPPGYQGIHCETVKTSLPSDNLFATSNSLNLMNINLYTNYWGQQTYALIKAAVKDHYGNYLQYYQNNLLWQTTGQPTIDDSNFVDTSKINLSQQAFTVPNVLAGYKNTNLYWCYEVDIFSSLIDMVRVGSLKNSVITIFTQHPPSSDSETEALEILQAFGIRVNVIWIYDRAFLRCTADQISNFKSFAESTGGLFVQLQSLDTDISAQTLISRVLNTHLKHQVITSSSYPDCSTKVTINWAPDTNINSPYYFVFTGDSVATDVDSARSCRFQDLVRSYDGKLAITVSPIPQCTSFAVQANGACSVLVYTTDVANVGVNIYNTFVESPSLDSSRYAIIEDVPFYAAFHIEPTGSSSVNVTGLDLVASNNPITNGIQKRDASFEYISASNVSCDSNSTEYLRLNLTINDVPTQRTVRINCVPTPPPPTVSTTESTTVSTVGTTINTDTTTEVPTTSTAEVTTTEAPSTTTEAPSTTTEASSTSTESPSTSTEAPSTTTAPANCSSGNPIKSTFLFIYPIDMTPETYRLSSPIIAQTISSNRYTNVYGDVRSDSSVGISINYNSDYGLFASNLTQNQPNNTLASEDRAASNFDEVLVSFLANDNGSENSIVLLFVNRLPSKESTALDDGSFTKLVNSNIKIFSIISQNSLINSKGLADRSGALLNKIAALTNGHYIVANDTIDGGRSDFSDIVQKVMNFGTNQDLLYTRNFGYERLVANRSLGIVQIPNSDSGNITLTISITLSALDNKLPQLPNLLRLAFAAAGTEPAQSFDFIDNQGYKSSNFFYAQITIAAGQDREILIVYNSADSNDLSIRIWIDRVSTHSAAYLTASGDSNLTTVPNVYDGAGLIFTLKDQCDEKPATIQITNCNGNLDTKYDVYQSAVGSIDEDHTTLFHFVPYFCDSQQTSATTDCSDGTSNKYDIQIKSDSFSASRSFLCQASVKSPDSTCSNKDSAGNYRCSGSSPFKRGTNSQLPDCSDHGRLEYDATLSGTYKFKCDCDTNFNGDSCAEISCASPNTDPLATDSSYHTYTVVIGIDGDTSDSFTTIPDAKSVLSNNLTNNDKLWRYQLLVRCIDGTVQNVYSGGSLNIFQDSFDDKQLENKCVAPGASNSVDIKDVYSEAVRGIGNNIRGIIVFFTETSTNLNISLDEFYSLSQTYKQQLFIVTVDETTIKGTIDANVSQAALSTGGFVIQTLLDNNENVKLQPSFFSDLLAAESSSIAFAASDINTDFDFTLERDDSVAYLITLNRGAGIYDNNALLGSPNCIDADDTMVICKITTKGLNAIKSTSSKGPYSAIVYVLNDVSPSAIAISDLEIDSSDAVSTSSSASRTKLAFSVPSNYTIIPNLVDDGISRLAQRNGDCQFGWTTYSIFQSSIYQNGFNLAKITLQKDGDTNSYVRYFPLITTEQTVCQNGGTPNPSSGSCTCSNGYSGPLCSQVSCQINAKSNAWSNACVCDHIDDATCAKDFISSWL